MRWFERFGPFKRSLRPLKTSNCFVPVPAGARCLPCAQAPEYGPLAVAGDLKMVAQRYGNTVRLVSVDLGERLRRTRMQLAALSRSEVVIKHTSQRRVVEAAVFTRRQTAI